MSSLTVPIPPDAEVRRVGPEPPFVAQALVTLAKGLGGIGVPAGAVLMREDLDVLDSFEHSFTSGANPLSLAATETTIGVVTDEGFLTEVRRKGARLGARLKRLGDACTLVGDVRGLGMMWGLEISGPDGLPDPGTAREIIRVARDEERLILRPSRYGFGNVVKVRPALIADDGDLDAITDRLGRALARVERSERKGAR